MDIKTICMQLKKGYEVLSCQNASQKNAALLAVSNQINIQRSKILDANKHDIENARKHGMSEALVERLMLDDKRIDGIIDSIRIVIAQTDPIGEETEGWTIPNGLQIRQIRVPLGVAAIIYESRPNVTIDAFCLAYKSGNALLLRGSSSAIYSNKALMACIKEGLSSIPDGVPTAVELLESTDHADIDTILSAVGYIDVALPRGGAKLIQTVVDKAKIPVIQTGSGVCHTYIDDSADDVMAANIVENAKIQRPGACNALETLLVHKSKLSTFLPILEQTLGGRVQLRADDVCYPILKAAAEKSGHDCIVHATQADFGFEFLDFICAVKCVESVEEAIDFINTYNTKHSECIVTNTRSHARLFQTKVDAACIYVNASTRFTDGGQFGFGAELGISTQKLHARGPMGIKALTTTKFLIDGEGQIR
ncbi:MAG: glutamate-5-semialdehyde dehydrogenase [Treponema sp.]|nr:glutamate-5-semialdehyde dehydrogenase [Treponema sp.]